MARRYFVSPLPPAGEGLLPQEVGHHVAHVLRRPAGAEIVLFDGQGAEADAQILEVRRGAQVTATVGAHRAVHRGPEHHVEIAVALPKGQRSDWLFEHGTEVGIATFRPVWTERSANRAAEVSERWHRIVAAAAGQCDRSHLPRLLPPVPLATLWEQDLPERRFVADLEGPAAAPASAPTILLVGPEGGLTPAERDAALAHGFAPRSLGPLTLRTETAALVGAARLLG